MDSKLAAELISVACLLVGAYSTYIARGVHLSIAELELKLTKKLDSFPIGLAELRLEIVRGRAQDRDELRGWINGSFMRAAEIKAHLEDFDRRLGERS